MGDNGDLGWVFNSNMRKPNYCNSLRIEEDFLTNFQWKWLNTRVEVGQSLSTPPTVGNDTVVCLLCYYLNISAQSTHSQEGGRLSLKVWIVVTTQSRPNYNESYKPTVWELFQHDGVTLCLLKCNPDELRKWSLCLSCLASLSAHKNPGALIKSKSIIMWFGETEIIII